MDTTAMERTDVRVSQGSSGFLVIEKKWSKRWAEEKVFEVEPTEKKEKKYITAAFPYPNSPQHIGHGRTYTTTDIYARYLRLKGYNVLFPMAFHVTGTPIIAMAKRIADKDEDVLSVFEKIYGIDRKTAATLTKPEDLVTYFSKEIELGMKEMGYSIDWRRKFYSFDKFFNKFIEWQFKKLHDHGLIIQGEHPIAWCPKDNQAVGGHDTKGDADPELKDFTAVKFAYADGFILTATLRPETIYAVTNIWVNPNNLHVKVTSKKTGEIYYLSKKACVKMNFQGFELEILEEIKGEKLLSNKAKNIVTGEEIPLYPAPYVEDDTGTGIVMSVPSHAPYDHIALVDMGIHLDYKQIIQVEGYKFMAKELIEKMGVKDQNDPKLEEITSEVYKKEILSGVMLVGPYSGEKVSVAIDKTKQDMFAKNQALVFWEITNKPVFCRCGAEVVVSILKNQWFIDYAKPEWKKKAKECLEQMSIIPEKTRSEYLYAIDWFKQKACARASGLGTRFPFDKTQMIEALSDSTIYMAFYTIAHLLKEIDESELNEAFFNYVFLGKGKAKNEVVERLKESFEYWYPLDSRHSGADLVRNHLPFFIFNHVAIFEKKYWPKQIVTNGFVLMDGSKMSKSMGNILPLRKAIAEYGADVIRFSVVCGADLSSDTDFNKSVAEGIRSRMVTINKLLEASIKNKSKSHGRAEKWLLSRINRKIVQSEKMYSEFHIRELALDIFYDVISDLQWYMKRSKEPNLHDFFVKWVPLIAPFMPHYAEEYWEMLGQKGFVVNAAFPKSDNDAISDKIEKGEDLVAKVRDDIENLKSLLKIKPSKVSIFVANDLKRKIYSTIANEKTFDKIMKSASSDAEMKTKMDVVQKMAKALAKTVHSLGPVSTTNDELDALQSAVEFFESEFNCKFSVQLEDDSQHERAKNAMPGKPAIVLE
ncbi:MAG: leucine--tRNA ligase [Candidatus Micrarchaeota archaeon]